MRTHLRQHHPRPEATASYELMTALPQETCDRLIGQAKLSAGASGDVYQGLMSTLGAFPGMDAVAAAMHLTTRALRPAARSGGNMVSGHSR